MIDRADDIMTTQGPHETRSERWIYLQNIMKSLQVSSFWILELWSTICFLRSRWLLTFGHQQSAHSSGCIQMSSLHFTSLHFSRRRHGRIHRKSRSLKCPNSHSIRSKEPQENSCKLHHYSTTSGYRDQQQCRLLRLSHDFVIADVTTVNTSRYVRGTDWWSVIAIFLSDRR